MTVSECTYIYGTRDYTTSVGDTLTTVAVKLYGSDEGDVLNVLKSLNIRFDWCNLKPGTIIKYLSKECLTLIKEV